MHHVLCLNYSSHGLVGWILMKMSYLLEIDKWHFVSSRISLMSFAHQAVGLAFLTWYRGLWLGRSPWWSVLVREMHLKQAENRRLLYCKSTCPSVCHMVYIWIVCLFVLGQVKGVMEKYGGARGWGRTWLWKSSHLEMNSPGSERLKSTTLSS